MTRRRDEGEKKKQFSYQQTRVYANLLLKKLTKISAGSWKNVK